LSERDSRCAKDCGNRSCDEYFLVHDASFLC